MAKLITIEKTDLADGNFQDRYCKQLEAGNILYLPFLPFNFSEDDLQFLLAQRQTGAKNRKNIAYKPKTNTITNAVELNEENSRRLLGIMQRYSQSVSQFLSELLEPYASKWRLDYASFRPFQEKGRQLRVRARNDLLHVDSFPTRPMNGNRIMRFFTNINPTESRFWITSDPLEVLAARFGGKEVPFPKNHSLLRSLAALGQKVGLPITPRSPYDVFMLNLHNFLKENQDFQATCNKDYWEFPPMSCWIVFTDQVSHAATAGQYALEQTILVPPSALVNPETAPISVIENLKQKMVVET
ncbi:MAG: Kdo hydroxylase family protein [Verrucomicrobia bacterium]|nr:Kdo hydroxylase family protein [Verrucomicrobiota bacterium]